MAVLKNDDIKKMSKEERTTKLKELRMELIKKHVQANKAGKVKTKEIKKAIARILTINNQESKNSKVIKPQIRKSTNLSKK